MATAEPEPEPPPRYGTDERATWAAYAAALRGVTLGRAGDTAPAERALPSAA